MLGKTGSNQYIKARMLGLDYSASDQTKQKISDSLRGKKWSDERRSAHSDIMRTAVLNHPDSYTANNVCGRSKRITVDGITYKSSWEFKVASLMIEANVKFQYEPKTPFEYMWNDKTHNYYPDFYLPDFDLYIEVKGFTRERDLCKWKAVKNLKIIDRLNIHSMNVETFLSFINT